MSTLIMRGLKAKATVLDRKCDLVCTLRTELDRSTMTQIDTISIEYIIDSDGQEVLTNMLSYDQLKDLLSTVKHQIKPL